MAQGTNSITSPVRIGICAPSTPFKADDAARVSALAAASHPHAELIFNDQCYFTDGHFAGNDAQRADHFVAMANDPKLDAIWFARGGYGAVRIAAAAIGQLGPDARRKTYLGYSDAGNLLGALYRANIGTIAHGPMPADITRADGERAVRRALDWIVDRKADTLEPGLEHGQKFVAFNLMTLAMMTGTNLMPDMTDHVLLIEEISEYLYAFDRATSHLCANLENSGLAGIKIGRVSDIPENDRPFGQTAEQIVRHWCGKFDIPFLGEADIGHDTQNKIVPFGLH